jgi:FkbM family methyltransferase
VPYVASNFELFFSAVHPKVDPEGFQVADFSRPSEHRLVEPDLIIETAGFPDRLNFEAEYFHWYSPAPGDIVWDLGANVGIASLVISQLVGPSGLVVAVEPDPINYKFLVRNLERHKVTNVEPVNCAISDHVGKELFFSDGTMFSGLASARRDGVIREQIGNSVEIGTETLDSLALRYRRPNFIKMDIEGAEIEALRGGADTLAERPAIACETNHLRNGVRTQFEVEAILRSFGYTVDTGRPLGSFITWGR